MSIYSLPDSIKNITIILFILSITSFLYAQEPDLDSTPNYDYPQFRSSSENNKETAVSKKSSMRGSSLSWQKKKNLSELQKQARVYRAQGLESQHIGNIDDAMSLYQKAIELDPSYAVAYNDLGIISEAKGFIDRAEECYLKSIEIDPNYLSAYTNLALLYENKRDLNKAAVYWKKRVESGLPNDPWTQKAKKRLEDISLVLSNRPAEDIREQEIVRFMKDVAMQKVILTKDDKELSKNHFKKAKQSYDKEDYATSIKEALDAQQLNPANKEIEKFIEEVQTRALSQ